MSERRVAVLIFTCLLLAYLYVFPHWLDWNQGTRFDLTAAIVERSTLFIDDYVSNTGDYAEYNGHAYSDKAPGLSFLAVPVYALIRSTTEIEAVRSILIILGRSPGAARTVNRPIDRVPPDEFIFAARLIFTTWLIVAIPSALFGAWLYRYLARFDLSARGRALAVLAYGLATVTAPYSAALYGHQVAAMLLFGAWAWLSTRRQQAARPIELFAIGSLLGCAVIIEYPAVLIAALIGLYAGVTQRRAGRIVLIVAGGIWPLLLLGAYNAAIFGSPFTLTYQYLGNPRLRVLIETGVFSAGWPSLEALWGLTFSPYRGLFFMSPIMLLALAGIIVTASSKAQRPEWWSSLSIVIVFTLLVSGSAQWWGGWSVGPRYLIPMLPWLVWPLGVTIERLLRNHAGQIGLIALITASLVSTWSLAAGGQYYAPDDIANPLIEYSWPKILAGDVARNWGMIAGLQGVMSMAPVAVLVACSFGLLWYATRTAGEQSDRQRGAP